MNKLFFILLGVLAVSCSSKKDNSNLTYWSSNNFHEIAFTKERAEKWNAANPDVRLEFQPIPEGQSSEEVIMAAVVGGTTPDIYANMWQGLVELYAHSRKLVALDTLDGFVDFITERCGEEAIKEITSEDGHIYQIPWKVNPAMTIYNVKSFAKIGVDSSKLKTYSDFLEHGDKLTYDASGDGYIDHWLGYTEPKPIWYERFFNFYSLYLAASGGQQLVENNRVMFDNEHAVAVFQFLQELYKKGYFPKERLSSGQDRFYTGQLSMKWVGPYEVPHAEKFKPDDFEYDFCPLPVPDNHEGPVFTYGDPKNIVIFSTCTKPQKAWEFIKTMLTKEGDLSLMNYTSQLPRRKNLGTDPYFASYIQQNPKVIPFARQANYVYGTDNCTKLVEVFDIISQEYERCVLHNKISPEEAIDNAAKAVNVLLGNF